MAVRRYLGVDYGTVRIGLAIAEDDVRVARPWQIIEPAQPQAARQIQQIVKDEHITTLVVGLPRSLAGDDTQQTVLTRRFASALQALGLDVQLQDEADTSQLARQRQPKQKRVDAEAAAIILQDYLEQL